MPNIRTLQRSFGGGLVAPEFFGRIDDQKYQTGLSLCRNFIILPHGPAQNRPGFAFVRAVKDSTKKTRLIPFTYSTDQTMVIELGAGYIRFHTAGATVLLAGNPYEITNPYAESELFDIHYVQSADVLTLVHPGHAPMELRRLGATNWTLTAISFTPTLSAPATVSSIPKQNAAPTNLSRYTYAVTSVGDNLQDESAASANSYSYRVAVTALSKANPGVLTFGEVHGFAVNDRLYVSGFDNQAIIPDGYYLVNSTPSTKKISLKTTGGTPVNTTSYTNYSGGAAVSEAIQAITNANPAVFTVSADHNLAAGDRVFVKDVGLTAVPDGYYYVDTTPGLDTLTLLDSTQTVVDLSAAPAWPGTGGVILAIGAKNNLLQADTYNTISWTPVAGAKRYNVYRESNGLYGYIGQAVGTTFKDDNIAPDISRTPPELLNPFVSAGNYPAAVTYFEQRRCFAGTTNQPQNIWMTRPGTESNLSYSIPSRDDDGIAFRVAAREANTIRHLVPLSSLVMLTSAAEWRASPVNSDAITPTTISVRPQSYIGAANAQPVIINNNMIYAAARGGHVRELAYNWQASGYITGDLSLRAPHLFDGLSISDIAYGKSPIPTCWFVSSDGSLLGLTYVPDQQVGAWHRHDTDGVFESVAVVAEGAEDRLYAVIRRTINGNTVRYVERMAPMLFADLASAFFVDAGATYDGAPATTISGLTHLEGETVSILADGAVMPQQVVTAGAVTLQHAASKVHIGLPITADLQTLPIAFEVMGYGQGREKNVNKAWLRVNRSSGIFVGPRTDALTEAKQRTTEPFGSPPALKSEEISVMITPAWSDSGQIVVRQSDPLPLTLVSLSLEVSIGG